MALADFFRRSAVAASQVLAGFDENRIRLVLERVRVGIALGPEVANSKEGMSLLDLLVRLLARMYPVLTIRAHKETEALADSTRKLALRINPKIEFSDEPTIEIVIGNYCCKPLAGQRIFAGARSWNAFISSLGPQPLGNSLNPFGAGVAACLAAARVFRAIFQVADPALEKEEVYSVLTGDSQLGPELDLEKVLGEAVLVGTGAVGNAAAWALSRTPVEGVLHLVDHQAIDLGNLQRYVLAERSDVGSAKVKVLEKHFVGSLRVSCHTHEFAAFISSNGHAWPRMLLALDTSKDRKAAQASLPRWIANGWTQPGDLGVSFHDFRQGACVTCMYLPKGSVESEDSIVAQALGIPALLMEVRTLLYSGAGVQPKLLEAIAAAHSLPLDTLLAFENRPIRELYSEGFCGGAVLPLGSVGTPRQEVHVPLAHQSALCGVLLAGALARDILGQSKAGTFVTRINVLKPLGSHLTQAASKDPRGICICQDQVFREVYERKYESNGLPLKAST